MNKTNIIVTVGPSSNTKEVLKDLISGGASVIRINLNYCDHDFCRDIVSKIRDIDTELGTVTSIMFDTVGPDIKTGSFSGGKASFTEETKIRVYNSSLLGDETKLFIDYADLVDDVPNNTIIKLNMTCSFRSYR